MNVYNQRRAGPFEELKSTNGRTDALRGRNISCVCAPVTSRLLAIWKLVGQLITLVAQTAYDLVPTTLSFFSCGHFCDHSEAGSHQMRENLVENTGKLFECILHVVNPDAVIALPFRCYTKIQPITDRAFEMSYSQNLLHRHVTARALYLVEFIGGLVLRVADAALGLLATPLALVTGGQFQKLNGRAAIGFEALGGIVGDTVRFIAMMISPRMSMGRRPPN